MSKRVLITGTHRVLALQLGAKLRTRGDEVRIAIPDSQELGVDHAEETIPWNPTSTLSTRAVIAACKSSLERCDLAYVLCGAGAVPTSFHEPSAVSLQEYVDTNLTGPTLMLKELLQHFLTQEQGSIVLIHHQPGGLYESPLYVAVQAALEQLGDELFRAYAESPVTLQGFRSSESDLGVLSDSVSEETPTLRSSTKWQRLGARSGRFPFRNP